MHQMEKYEDCGGLDKKGCSRRSIKIGFAIRKMDFFASLVLFFYWTIFNAICRKYDLLSFLGTGLLNGSFEVSRICRSNLVNDIVDSIKKENNFLWVLLT